MKDYYYIKLKSKDYDGSDWFLTNDGISPHPGRVKIFDDIDNATEIKNYLKVFYFDYDLEIKRF